MHSVSLAIQAESQQSKKVVVISERLVNIHWGVSALVFFIIQMLTYVSAQAGLINHTHFSILSH